MRVLKYANLSYGLVTVPVGVATAAKRKDIAFKTLHAACGQPIKQLTHCPICDVQVEKEETVHGYEVAKKTYVTLDEERLNSIAAERSTAIIIDKFVPFGDVDDLSVEASYYLTPSEALPTPYAVLSAAMMAEGVVGIGSQCLWGKETPAMVWPTDSGSLVCSKLFCSDEVVPDGDITPFLSFRTEQEVERACAFIRMVTERLLPGDLVSESRVRMRAYVDSVVHETEFETAEPGAAMVPSTNLMDALNESIRRIQEEKEAA